MVVNIKPRSNVIITIDDIYVSIQVISSDVQKLGSRLDIIESKIENSGSVDERSREALNIAEDALELAQKLEKRLEWLWNTIIGALIAGAIGALFVFAQNGLGG